MRKVLLLVILGMVLGTILWWISSVEREVARIRAAHDDKAQGEPVYAQFVYTQRLNLSEPASISELRVPVWASGDARSFEIALMHEGLVIDEWQYVGKGEIEMAELELDEAVVLRGEVEVRLASGFSHAERGIAPRVFIEKADGNYPNGNYRVAENEKAGDVALTLLEEKRRGEVWLESWRSEPVRNMTQTLVVAAMCVLVLNFPTRLGRNPDTK